MPPTACRCASCMPQAMRWQGTKPAEWEVTIAAGHVELTGNLSLPRGATGIVLFAHGSGSSRLSPRNVYVARAIQARGIGTLLFDLLTRQEEEIDSYTRHYRFDISLLGKRLIEATEWLDGQPGMQSLRVGYFGASTGSAAALIAAAALGQRVSAVVSRGGRPDLTPAEDLAAVTAPTLLIVGGHDDIVIDLNRQACAHLRSDKELTIVPGASHLFEEPGTLDEVARLASEWFERHLHAHHTTA
jgi:putative phosphoribosyl transferase